MRVGTFGSYSAVHSKLPLMVPGLERQTDAPQQSESLRQRENGGKQGSAAEESQSASSRGRLSAVTGSFASGLLGGTGPSPNRSKSSAAPFSRTNCRRNGLGSSSRRIPSRSACSCRGAPGREPPSRRSAGGVPKSSRRGSLAASTSVARVSLRSAPAAEVALDHRDVDSSTLSGCLALAFRCSRAAGSWALRESSERKTPMPIPASRATAARASDREFTASLRTS